jgi:DNA-binding PadR family transcriptional regulator
MKANANKTPPLSPATLHILLALAGGDLHGYGIIQEVARHSEGHYKPGPGTLYDNLKKLMDAGLVVDAPRSGVDENDERRFYSLTVDGGRAEVCRNLYSLIIRLHPRPFRDRFGDEMLWIFDEARSDGSTSRLLFDGLFSLLRQHLQSERELQPVVVGFQLSDSRLAIAPQHVAEAGITATLLFAGFIVLLGHVGEPFVSYPCLPLGPHSADRTLRVPARIPALSKALSRAPRRVDASQIDRSVQSAIQIVRAQELANSETANYCPQP